MLRRVLEPLGYRVVTVESALHATEALSEIHEFSCVITDYKMVGPNGVSLLDYVERWHPGVGRVVFTGRPDADVALARARHFVIEKTQPLRKLIDAIERAIRGEKP